MYGCLGSVVGLMLGVFFFVVMVMLAPFAFHFFDKWLDYVERRWGIDP